MLKNPTRNAEFLATQLQSAGYFQLADDEALVLTIDPGDAEVLRGAGDQRLDDHRRLLEPADQPEQRAGHAHRDGVYTIVISPNGSRRGELGVHRWPEPGHDLDPVPGPCRSSPTHLPTVDVPGRQAATELDTVLPAGTVYYVTPDERDAQLAVRKAGFDNRFAPYPQPTAHR